METQQFYFDRPHANIALKTRDVAGLAALGFTAKEVIGRGTFALVFKVRNEENESFAVKKLFIPKEIVGKKSMLQSVPRHPNILPLFRVFESDEKLGIGHVAFEVYEQFDMNLEQLIKALRQGKSVFPPNLLRHVVVALLRGLAHLHAHGIVHRDIKPSNVLLKFNAGRSSFTEDMIEESELLGYNDTKPENVKVVISDFGHAILANESRTTAYVSTRFYRAPELLLGYLGYTSAVDMWALGCVIGEMLRLRPLFHGDSATAVLGKILTTLGNIEPATVERYTREKIQLAEVTNLHPLEQRAASADAIVFSLMKALLNCDDKRRPTAEQALEAFLKATNHYQERVLT